MHVVYKVALGQVGVTPPTGRMHCFVLVPTVKRSVMLMHTLLINSLFDWRMISRAFLANRRIALDMCQVAQPIGVDEALHRIVRKTV